MSWDLVVNVASIVAACVSGLNCFFTCRNKAKLNKAETELKKELGKSEENLKKAMQESAQKHDEKMLELKNQADQIKSMLENVQAQKIGIEDHRCQAIDNYLRAVGKLVYDPFGEHVESEFGQSISEIFMYAPEKRESIQKMNKKVDELLNSQELASENYSAFQALQNETKKYSTNYVWILPI